MDLISDQIADLFTVRAAADPAMMSWVVMPYPRTGLQVWSMDILPGVRRSHRTARGWPRPSWIVANIFGAAELKSPERRRSVWSGQDLGIPRDDALAVAMASVAPKDIPQGLFAVAMYTRPSRDDVAGIARRFLVMTRPDLARGVEPVGRGTRTPRIFSAVVAALDGHVREGHASSYWQQDLIPRRRMIEVRWAFHRTPDCTCDPKTFLETWGSARPDAAQSNDVDDGAFVTVMPFGADDLSGRSVLAQILMLPSPGLQDIALGADWSAYLCRGPESWYRPQYIHQCMACDPAEVKRRTRAYGRGSRDANDDPTTVPREFRRLPTRFAEPLSAQVLRAHAGVGCHPSTRHATIGVLGWDVTTWACIDLDNHWRGNGAPTVAEREQAHDDLIRRVTAVRKVYRDAIAEARYELVGINPALGAPILGLWRIGDRVVHRNPRDPRHWVAGVHCWVILGGWRRRAEVVAEIHDALRGAGLAATDYEVFPDPNKAISLPLRREPRPGAQQGRASVRVDDTVASYELIDDDLFPSVAMMSRERAERLGRSWSGNDLLASTGYRRMLWQAFDRLWTRARRDPRAVVDLPETVQIRARELGGVPVLGAEWELPDWARPPRHSEGMTKAWTLEVDDTVPWPLGCDDPPPIAQDPRPHRRSYRAILITASLEAEYGELALPAEGDAPARRRRRRQRRRSPLPRPVPPASTSPALPEAAETVGDDAAGAATPFTPGRRNDDILAMVRAMHAWGCSEAEFLSRHDLRYDAAPMRTPKAKSREQAQAAWRLWCARMGPPQRTWTPSSLSPTDREAIIDAARAGVLRTGLVLRKSAVEACARAIATILVDAAADPASIGVRLLAEAYLGRCLDVAKGTENRRPQSRLKAVIESLGAKRLTPKEAARRVAAAHLDVYVGRAPFFDLWGLIATVVPLAQQALFRVDPNSGGDATV
ncbi:MAG: hypothetical protein J0M02_01305 [Planctomycetes bacterium]|nr:hypothetical protein [Planctomycetota bacterium]